MSEKSKGSNDTYATAGVTPTRVPKNPLLSASVTGLTFDDFPNKPLLLPAAPPISHVPIISPTLAAIGGEIKPLVTVGKSSNIDSECLDEINLNTPAEEAQLTDVDLNANEASQDSILSQAASSFSALPSVASTVFSTFSKRLYAGSTSREKTPDIQNSQQAVNDNQRVIPQAQQFATPAAGNTPAYYAPPLNNNNFDSRQNTSSAVLNPEQSVTAPAAPPTFYAPAEVLTTSSLPTPPLAPAGQNTYRLTAKKKIYAPIPGFCDQSAQLPLLPSVLNTSAASVTDANNQLPEQQKSNLFSLSNLAPSGILQNISGIVNTATGNKAQEQQATQPQILSTQPINNFSTQNQILIAPATTTTIPSSQPSTTQLPPPPNFGFPAPFSNSGPSILAQPVASSQTSSLPGTVAVYPPSVNLSQLPPGTQFSAQFPNITAEDANSKVSGEQNIFAGSSTNQPPQPESGLSVFTSSAVATQNIFLSHSADTKATFTNQQKPRTFGFPLENTRSEVLTQGLVSQTQQAVFPAAHPQTVHTPQGLVSPPTAAVQTSAVSFFNPQSTTNSAAQPINFAASFPTPIPPPATATVKPPSGTAAPASFRLQKGTKLYKSPLTSAELAATNIPLPQSVGIENPTFNSFGQSNQPAAASANYFNPNSSFTGTSLFLPNQSQQQTQNLIAVQQPLLQQNTAANASANFFTPFQSTSTAQLSAAQPFILAPTNQQTLQQVPLLQQEQLPQQTTILTEPIQLQQTQDIQPILSTTTTEKSTPQSLATSEQTIQQQQLKLLEHQQPTVSAPRTQEHTAINQPTQSLTTEQSLKIRSLDQFETATQIETVPSETAQELKPQQLYDVSKDNFLEEQIIEPVASEEIENQQQTASEATDPLEETIKKLVLEPPSNKLPLASVDDNSNTLASAQGNHFSDRKPHEATAPPLPPPSAVNTATKSETNPFRRHSGGSAVAAKQSATVLASFFTPVSVDSANKSAGDFDIFAQALIDEPSNSQSTEKEIIQVIPPLPEINGIATPALLQEGGDDSALGAIQGLPPPIGFDNIVSGITTAVAPQTAGTAINFFNQTPSFEVVAAKPSLEQQETTTKSFFDNLSGQQPPVGKENQRLQNFFNNPPLNLSGDAFGLGDLNYAQNILKVNDLENRSFSNIAEPSSSVCSEFSETKRNNNNSEKEILKTLPDATDSTKYFAELPEEVLNEFKMANLLTGEKGAATDPPPTKVSYKPALKHWFYKQSIGQNKFLWTPFSHYDSALLETSLEAKEDAIVAVEGGRYDVNIAARTKVPVYWEGDPIEVRRCSWFYKGVDSKYVPYEEHTADVLEAEYKAAAESGEWHKKIMLTFGEQVVFHGPTVIVHFQKQQSTDAWGGSSQTSTRPRVVKRDLDDFHIEQGNCQKVDHLLFMVHGIGSACDLRMRSLEEVVDDFRSIAAQLVQSHYKNSCDACIVGRVEVLPISWHGQLHSTELGIDEKLKSITLESIPKLRNFTNETLLDVLFYTSPTYCQKIMNTVAASLNAVYMKYRQRHPDFTGGVSLAGHSLGSLILFDLLCHQNCPKETEEQNLENPDAQYSALQQQDSALAADVRSKQVSYTMGPAGTGQPFINYTQLIFQPKKFFALGSPIGMFVTIRGIDKLGLDFRLPTCPGFYNIFHPFDPVAYRIEALVNPEMSTIRPVLIPHHKGRKRMHLELKETMTRVSADLKQRFVETFRNTLGSVNFLNSHKHSEREVEETVAHEVLDMQTQLDAQQIVLNAAGSQMTMRSRTDSTSSNTQSEQDIVEIDFPLGKLNDSKRIDYVLQEAPLEFFNEYLFALSSHVCYWDSADTILFVIKEIYSGLGVSTDSQVPQQSMTIDRPSSRNSLSQSNL